MSKSYKGRGIVLNSLKYGDSSLIVHLLTDVLGRQNYIVQGVKSSRGRGSKMALFQPLFALEFEGSESRYGEMHRFKEVQSGVLLSRTPYDVRRSTVALFVAEVLYRLIKEREPNPELFDYAWGSLIALDTIEEGVANFHLWFLANLSRLLGFYPNGEWQKGWWIDVVEGGYTPTKPNHSLYLTPEYAELMRDFTECDVQHLGEIGLNRGQRVEFLSAILNYYGYHLDSIKSVQSVEILREVF
ncbi:MAG: DNA repair protein RecO [Rikenellaceae bacterium]